MTGLLRNWLGRRRPSFRKLLPKSEHSWRLKLTRSIGSVLTDAILHIRAEFDVAQKPQEAPGPAGAGGAAVPGNATPANMTATAPESIHQLIYGIAKIKPLTAITGIELARAEIKGLPESLAHERPGQMFVVVTNQYSSPLTVKDVKPLGPSYIELLAPTPRTLRRVSSPGSLLSGLHPVRRKQSLTASNPRARWYRASTP